MVCFIIKKIIKKYELCLKKIWIKQFKHFELKTLEDFEFILRILIFLPEVHSIK